MQRRIACFSDIIARWDKVADFAADIGVTPKHAFGMKLRNAIPPAYWPYLLEAAWSRGYREITEQLLVDLGGQLGRERLLRRRKNAS